jgi:oligopeptide/dipeptide ABC transporter ATP-binding protein
MAFICHDLALVSSFAHQIAVMYLGSIVEVLPGESIAREAKHPYTQALLGAQFSLHMDFSKKIESIESEAPSPLRVPAGCPFRDRCGECIDRCKTEKPVLTALTEDHAVACHRVQGKEALA